MGDEGASVVRESGRGREAVARRWDALRCGARPGCTDLGPRLRRPQLAKGDRLIVVADLAEEGGSDD